MRWGLLAWLVVVAIVAFVARTAVVLATRRRHPGVAAFVDRWWAWTPAVALIVAVAWVNPILGIVLAVVAYLLLTRGDALGSPFRPRR
jgi:hypothetical protein